MTELPDLKRCTVHALAEHTKYPQETVELGWVLSLLIIDPERFAGYPTSQTGSIETSRLVGHYGAAILRVACRELL